MRKHLEELHRQLAIVGLDTAAAAAALTLAYFFRFDGLPPLEFRAGWLVSMPVLAGCTLCAFAACGAYRGRFEFAGTEDLLAVARGTACAALLFVGMLFLLGIHMVPRGIVIVALGLVFGLATAARLAPRLRGEVRLRPRLGRRTLILGAGRAGETIVREMLRQPALGSMPIGFADDLTHTWDTAIHGVPVLGGADALAEIVRLHRVEEIIIATPSATGAQMRRLVDRCQSAGVPFRTVPSLREVMDGRVSVQSVREVRIEDLLGRHPVRIDPREVRAFLHGKRVLVTGAAGSIGSELCRQVATYDPERLILFDHDENGLFYLERELQASPRGTALDVVLCDITHEERLRQVLAAHAPHVVFHAAAHKHVPLMERNVVEAVRNNVFGTAAVVAAAENAGVESFVLISTDKAVCPTSVMGATKRVAGHVVQARATSRTRFVSVRFGNVLGSQGSVFSIFRDQIARGGPLTITSRDMKRFFMTIPEAVQLIAQAAAMGRGGETFVLDMGEPVSIDAMARQMIRLSGLEPDRDIAIEYTGLRPGEKVVERLWSDDEAPQRTAHPRIWRTAAAGVEPCDLHLNLERLAAAMHRGSEAEVLDILCTMVPDFTPDGRADASDLAPSPERRDVA